MPVKGVATVKRNFRQAVGKIAGPMTERAIYATLSEGAAMASVITPVHTGNLINSQTAPQIAKSGSKTTGTIGYTAEYAGAVHDKPGTLKGQPRPDGSGNFWDPSGEPAFLEKGFDEIKPNIPNILKGIYGA